MNEIDWELVDRYLSGEQSPNERAQFQQWLDASPLHRLFLEATREATIQLSLVPNTLEQYRGEVWHRLRRDLNDEIGSTPTAP